MRGETRCALSAIMRCWPCCSVVAFAGRNWSVWRWYVVRTCCERAGLEHIAPHDLRRTCAKRCHDRGGELEQIQFLLGHASVQTTERYLGCKQNLGHPVNDLFDL